MRGVGLVALALAGLLALSSAQDARKSDPKSSVRLIEYISKKNYDAFTEELSKESTDANQPDTKGRLPIFEAVKTKDLRFVDALIQFGAIAASKDPSSGASPLQPALAQNSLDIVRVLLAYGANPDTVDKNGKKPRDYVSSSDARKLLDEYDVRGPMGFEDEPGTWTKAYNDKKEQYWFNVATEEARWNVPPSCGWQRIEYQGQPTKYANYVTGQTTHKVPQALAWRHVRIDGQEVWYNWAVNKTQHEQPDEAPQYIVDEAKLNVNVRWYNEKTGEFSWEDPAYHTPWRVVKDDEGKEYYYNVRSGEATWDVPDELAWTKVPSEQHPGQHYWFNKKTGESTWETPTHAAWEKQAEDL